MGLINSKENENVQIAKEMLSLGIDIEQVCEITKLSKEAIEKIIQENLLL